jgi:translation initiation factor 3 subunit C
MRILEKLLEVAATPYSRIRVLLALISARFDYNASVTSYMPIDLWTAAAREVDQLIATLSANPKYIVQEVVNIDYDEMVERSPEDEKEGGIVRIRGSVISSVDRLDDEFTKSLLNIDPHGTEYIDRLKDSMSLYQIILRAQTYFEFLGDSSAVARVILRRVEHIYSKVVWVYFLLF